MTTKPEAERIAAAVNILRPTWLAKSIETQILDHHAARPARDVLFALCWVALDPASQTPSRINATGPWWDFQVPTDKRRTPDQPHPTCPEHPGQDPAACPECRPTLHPATPDRVAQLKAAIVRTTPTTQQPTLADLEAKRAQQRSAS